MKKSRKDWEAREAEFTKEDFEQQDMRFLGVMTILTIIGIATLFLIAMNV